MRYCKSIESRARADALAKKLLQKDDVSFWKEIKKLTSASGNIVANTVDNVTGEKEIAAMWQHHYEQLLNSNKDTSHKSVVETALENSSFCASDCVNFDIHDISDAIKKLKSSKSPRLDGLQAEHFKYAVTKDL